MYLDGADEKAARKIFASRLFEAIGEDEYMANRIVDLWQGACMAVHDAEMEREKKYFKEHEDAVDKRVNGLLVVQLYPDGVWHDRRVKPNDLTFCGREIPTQGIRERDRKDALVKRRCGLCGRASYVIDEQFYVAEQIEDGVLEVSQ
jgi:hypothetical protein